MKKNSIKSLNVLAMTALLSVAVLSGCSGTKGSGEASSAAAATAKERETTAATERKGALTEAESKDTDGGKLKVIASFYPMYDFAVKIGGDRAEVACMVPSGTEPHDWEPSASDLKNLEEADLFVYNGAGMEHWAEDVLAGLEHKALVTAQASQGLTFLEGHSHEEEEREEESHDHGHYDPHVWLSPMNGKKEMENIKNAYIKADPDHKDYYEANYETYAARFDELDQSYKNTLDSLPNKDIVVSHEAFGYLCNAYGLNQMGIEGLSPDSEPDPARMAEIIDFVKERNVKVIFFEELVSPKVAEAVAKETGAVTQVLNPLEGLSDEELKKGADYFSVMEDNLKQLENALK